MQTNPAYLDLTGGAAGEFINLMSTGNIPGLLLVPPYMMSTSHGDSGDTSLWSKINQRILCYSRKANFEVLVHGLFSIYNQMYIVIHLLQSVYNVFICYQFIAKYIYMV